MKFQHLLFPLASWSPMKQACIVLGTLALSAADLSSQCALAEVQAPGADYASSVGFSNDTLVVGAPSSFGKVYVYKSRDGRWAETETLALSGVEADDFGYAVDIEGGTLAVGARQVSQGKGAVYIYELPSYGQAVLTSTLLPIPGVTRFGNRIDLSGNRLVVCADEAAFVFEKSGQAWLQTARLQPNGLQAGTGFGWSVSLHGDVVALGASTADSPVATEAGVVYLFEYISGVWAETKLFASDGTSYDQFGHSVALDEGAMLVGAVGEDEIAEFGGAVYEFRRFPFGWAQVDKFISSDVQYGTTFGWNVALSGSRAVVSGRKWAPSLTAAIYAFDKTGQWTETLNFLEGLNYGTARAIALDGDRVAAGLNTTSGQHSTALFSSRYHNKEFQGCPETASLMHGDTQKLTIDAGPALGGHFYLIESHWRWRLKTRNLSGLTGSPPLAGVLVGGFGALNMQGTGLADYVVQPGTSLALRGLEVVHTCKILHPQTLGVVSETNRVSLVLQ